MRRHKNLLPRLALALLPLIAACTESIEGGAACPDLCPTENVPVRDTLLDAVVLDSALSGYPTPGEPSRLLLASAPGPDTLDVRIIIRFDSVPGKYFPSGAADSVAIARVDSSFLRLHFDTTGVVLTRQATIEAFDVDTTADADTTEAALNALFRADRRLGSVTIDSGGLTTDSLRIPLSNSAILAKATGGRGVRVGLRISSAARASLRIVSSRGGLVTNQARLAFDPGSANDTTYAPLVLGPTSATPSDFASIASGLRDFTIVAAGAVPALGNDLLIGGLPARRTFLRFDVPTRLVDSSTIVRATLQLVQRPVPGANRADTVQLETDIVVAERSVLDLRRVIDLVVSGASFGVDSVRLSPADSGARSVGIVNLVRAWRSLSPTTQRAVVLRAALEGGQAGALRFYSTEGPAAMRPRLRISYIPRTEFALP